MPGPVEFDGKRFGGAIEVQYIRPDSVLPSKFPTPQLPLLQHSPESCFSRGSPTAQVAASLYVGGQVVESTLSHVR